MSNPIGQFFNAGDYEPTQGTPKHPAGKKFQAYVSHTELQPLKDNKAGMSFAVTFTTSMGTIVKRYTVEHDNPDTQRISREQLSALCFATDTFKLTMAQNGFELRNKQCLIDVDPQVKNPDYNEVSMVYDVAGNVPRKKQAAAPAPAPQPAFQGQLGTPPQPAFQQPGYQPPPQQFAPQPQFAAQNGAPPQQFQQQPNPAQPPQFAQAGAPMPVTGKPAWAQ